MRDEPLGIDDHLLGLLHHAVCSIVGERHEEGLLRLDGEDAADDGEGRNEVCGQPHCCGFVVVVKKTTGV